MKENGRVKLTRQQLFWHYSIIPFLLIVPVLTTIDVIKYFVTHTYAGVRSIEDLVTWGYIWVIPAIAFYFIQQRRLQFQVIQASVDAVVFQEAVYETAKSLEWEIEKQFGTFVVAVSGFSWRSWGERITIIWEKDCILFNSIPDPDNRPSVTTFGMNRINKKLFEEHLQKAAPNTRLVKAEEKY